MTGIDRTSNALWRNPITEKGAAVADSKPVKLPPDRWKALSAHVQRDLIVQHELEQVIVDEPIEIDGITFLPAVYRAA